MNAMHLASNKGHEAIVQQLLEAGSQGQTAMHFASGKCHGAIVWQLLVFLAR